MSNTLLTAALSAVTNSKVISYDEYRNAKKRNNGYIRLDHEYFHQSHLIRGKVPTDDMNIELRSYVIIKSSWDKIITVDVDLNETISQLKAKIQDKESIPIDQQILIFSGKVVEGESTLLDHKIQYGCTLYLLILSDGGTYGLFIHPDMLDRKYDYDFTNENDEGITFMRGNVEYKRPCGWNRIALNVLNKYEDNNWIGVNKRRCLVSSVQNEWPVSYHGTAKLNCRSIAEDGYLLSKGKRFAFGYGIYSTPDINIAYQYATKFTYEGENYRIVLQNRVNPNNLIKIPIKNLGEIWISPNEDDVRPYGICIKKDD
ncbi:ubiquitin-domain-containing protein [Rhizophagus irregularis]|uniref:Ubiquitin-domain-containing protein n=1 Tax=Rhizophagus irregularis TaxID=588596 RepID=A0A2I1GEZ9_9GLOM|nr:ubiquitin-domain-containing protein [Rhizophagus irregularis]